MYVAGADSEHATGKVALVTGGARGIGRAIALDLARAGAYVAVADVNREGAERVAAEVRGLGRRGIALGADLSDIGAAQNVVGQTVENLSGIDILVNNAGRAQPKDMLDISPSDWESLFRVNVEGLFFCLQAAAKQMIAQGRGGRIVNIASSAGKEGLPQHLHYAASKACVISITRSAARGLAKHGILVNCVCPGIIDTDLWRGLDEEYARMRGMARGAVFTAAVQGVPLGRAGTPEDVARVVAFLCSPAAAYMTGQAVNVTGGLLLH